MTWKTYSLPAAALILSTSSPCFAVTYLSVEQAQKLIFPNTTLTSAPVTLSADQRKTIEKASDQRVRSAELKAWKVSGGGWFIVDEVLGKHEFITYAVGLDSQGAVTQVEIMEYRESYGAEVRDPKWLAQFIGKTVGAPLKLDGDVRNISGATLSSRHIADGVRRVLASYHAALES